jgi:cytochrome c oxidase subunit IV
MSKNEHAIHILPLRMYLMVGASLLALTFVTVYVSTFDFGEWNLIVAMIIAGVKATLVLFFFMHLYYDNKVYFSIFIGALLFLTIFIVFTMFDTQTRGQVDPAQENPIESKAVIYQPGGSALKGGHEEGSKPGAKADTATHGAAKVDSSKVDSTAQPKTAPAEHK